MPPYKRQSPKFIALPKLSICIPVYRQNVKNLVRELLHQIATTSESVELCLLDDGSDTATKEANAWLSGQKNILYRELPKNVERAAIRNRLAELASGDHLLFLDDDSEIDHPDFVKSYLAFTDEDSVVCGGRHYPAQLPGLAYSLHWHYGRKKESRPASQRAIHPYEAFHSNNFLIPKSVWEKTSFDESLTQYGHEDTLMGFELKKNGIAVKHIENAVVHAQLESNGEFLEKSRLALQNLKRLYERGDSGFNDSVKMLRAYQKLKNLKLKKPLARLFKARRAAWEKQLCEAANPSMRLFNQYKLGYLATL